MTDYVPPYLVLEAPPAVNAGATPTGEGAPESAQDSSSSLMGCEIGKARVLDPNGKPFSDNYQPMENR